MRNGAEPSRVTAPVPPAAGTPRLRQGRLFRKYLLLILTLVSGALLVSGGISLYFAYQEQKTALGDLQHEKAIAAASRIEQYIRQIEQQLAYAALPQLDASDVELRSIEFLKLLRQVPEVTDIAQLDADGREQVLVSRLGMDVMRSAATARTSRPSSSPKRGKPWIGPVYFRKETEPYMTIAVRSGSDTGPVTIADVNLKFIWDVVSRIKIGEKGKAYVVDSNGFLVADPDIGLVLRKTPMCVTCRTSRPRSRTASQDEQAMCRATSRYGRPHVVRTHRFAQLDRLRRAAARGGVRRAQRVDPAHHAPAPRGPRDLRVVRAGAGARHGAADPHARRRRAAHRRGRPRPDDRRAHGRRARGPRRPLQPHDHAAARVVRGARAQGGRAHARARQFARAADRDQRDPARDLELADRRATGARRGRRARGASVPRTLLSRHARRRRVLTAAAARTTGTANACHADAFARVGARPSPGGRSSTARRSTMPTSCRSWTANFPSARVNMRSVGCRAVLAVPLMREGGAYRRDRPGATRVRPFPPDQVALVQTFARQAAIAIDNVRLFNQTKEALDQQTATSEVLKTISRTAFELQPVLEALIENATTLCKSRQGRDLPASRRGLRARRRLRRRACAARVHAEGSGRAGAGLRRGLVAETGQVVAHGRCAERPGLHVARGAAGVRLSQHLRRADGARRRAGRRVRACGARRCARSRSASASSSRRSPTRRSSLSRTCGSCPRRRRRSTSRRAGRSEGARRDLELASRSTRDRMPAEVARRSAARLFGRSGQDRNRGDDEDVQVHLAAIRIRRRGRAGRRRSR